MMPNFLTSPLLTKLIAALLVASNLSLPRAHADASLPPLKVLGRGIKNRETGEVLQLACVGPRIENENGERSCVILRFLLTRPEGTTELQGPPLQLLVGEKVKRQLQDHYRRLGIASKKIDGGAWQLGVLALLAGGTAIATGGGAAPLLFVGILGGSPFLMHSIGISLSGQIKNVRLDQLQSRAVPAWQLRPTAVSDRKFSRTLLRIQARETHSSSIDPRILSDSELNRETSEQENAVVEALQETPLFEQDLS